MTKDKILNSFDVKKDLAPNFWANDNKLNPKIRETLLRVAHDFMDQTNIDWSNLVDIILTGSIANYTWSSYSDIDLHIIVDFEKFDIPSDLLWDYLSVKKEQWNNIHADLLVYNYPVEIYVEDKNEYAGSTGVYSILNDEWIKTPTQEKAEIAIDKDKIKRVAKKWIKAILFYKKKAYENNDVTTLEDTQEKLKRIFTILRGKRSSGLATPEKEMSFGNLLWKCLKRLGLIAEIWNTNYYIYDKLNSIREKLNEKLLSFKDTESENNDLENLNQLTTYKYYPKDYTELYKLVNKLIEERGDKADLNDIYTGNIIDMTDLFLGSNFNGDISKWDVSNVEDMTYMFNGCYFNGDISKWDVSNVKDMRFMFAHSRFNSDISDWDVSNVETMSGMFYHSNFNGDISDWDVSNVKDMSFIFNRSSFNGDISKWNINLNCRTLDANLPQRKVNEKLLSFEDAETKNNDLENLNNVTEFVRRKKYIEDNFYIDTGAARPDLISIRGYLMLDDINKDIHVIKKIDWDDPNPYNFIDIKTYEILYPDYWFKDFRAYRYYARKGTLQNKPSVLIGCERDLEGKVPWGDKIDFNFIDLKDIKPNQFLLDTWLDERQFKLLFLDTSVIKINWYSKTNKSSDTITINGHNFEYHFMRDNAEDAIYVDKNEVMNYKEFLSKYYTNQDKYKNEMQVYEKLLSFDDVDSEDNDLENLKVIDIAIQKRKFQEEGWYFPWSGNSSRDEKNIYRVVSTYDHNVIKKAGYDPDSEIGKIQAFLKNDDSYSFLRNSKGEILYFKEAYPFFDDEHETGIVVAEVILLPSKDPNQDLVEYNFISLNLDTDTGDFLFEKTFSAARAMICGLAPVKDLGKTNWHYIDWQGNEYLKDENLEYAGPLTYNGNCSVVTKRYDGKTSENIFNKNGELQYSSWFNNITRYKGSIYGYSLQIYDRNTGDACRNEDEDFIGADKLISVDNETLFVDPIGNEYSRVQIGQFKYKFVNLNANWNNLNKSNSTKKVNEKLLSFEDTDSEDNDLENLTKVSEVAVRKKWFDENCEIADIDKDLPKNSIIRIERKGIDMWDYKPLKGKWNFMYNDGSYKIISPDIWFTGCGRFEDGKADVYYLDKDYVIRNNIIDINGQFLLEDDPVQIIKNIRFIDNPYLKTYSTIQNRVTAMIETGIPASKQTSKSGAQIYIDFIDENNKRIRPKIDTSKMNYNDSWKISSYFTRNMFIQPNIIPVLLYALNDKNQSVHQSSYHYIGDIIYLEYGKSLGLNKVNKGLILDTNGNLYKSLEEAAEGMCKELGYDYDPDKISFGNPLGFKY